MAGFETHLGRNHADFALRLARGDAALDAWRTLAAAKVDPAWTAALQCVTRPSVRDLWLEFDVGQSARAPSVFFGLTDPPLTSPATAMPAHLRTTLEALGADPAAMRTLDLCYRAAPRGAQVFQVGMMLARPDRGLRILLRNLDAPAVELMLRRICAHAEATRVADAVRRWHQHTDAVFVSLDVGVQVGGRVGLELMFHDQSALDYDPRWAELLAVMHHDRLCSAAERDALLAWPGTTTQDTAGPHWPAGLTRAASLGLSSRQPAIARLINHAKLDLRPGVPTTAKAYFGWQTTWLRRGPLL